MKLSRFVTRAIAVVALAVVIGFTSAAGTARAGFVMNGTFGYGPLGDLAYIPSGSPISAATFVTIPSTELVNTVPGTYLGNPNLFGGLVALGDSITVSPLTLSTTSGPSILPDYIIFEGRFHYSMASIVWTTSAVSNLSFNSQGTFHDANGVYNDALASLSGSFTQTGGSSGTVNGSFTFATPPGPAVPEPATYVLMLEMIGGFVVLSRLRRKKP